MELPAPVLDAHIHLDPEGTPREAVRRFLKEGGTHLLVVHKPYGPFAAGDLDDYRRSYDTTVRMTDLAMEEGARAWCVLGPYPGEMARLSKAMGAETSLSLQLSALELAFTYVDEGRAAGIGEVGRVHFPVAPEVQAACDSVMLEAFKGCRERSCPAILHTESLKDNPDLLNHITTLADKAGLARELVVKHYSNPDSLRRCAALGLSSSLQSRKEFIKQALEDRVDFLFETDYIDDPKRPDVVMPPDTVPKKVHWALKNGLMDHDRLHRLMVEHPQKALRIDMS